MLPIRKNRSDKTKVCSVCQNWYSKANFTDDPSTGSVKKMCNQCFAPYKKVLELNVGDPVVYISPMKEQIFQEVEVAGEGYKNGSNKWYIRIRPVGCTSDGTLTYIKYLRVNE